MFSSYGSRETLDTYGSTDDERIYYIAFELCLKWINRILFLKLLEAQLFHYQQNSSEYKFLNIQKVSDFNHVFNLFHEVLAKPVATRDKRYAEHFKLVPYLNSSLFELSSIEGMTARVSELDDDVVLPLAKRTVLKEEQKNNRSLSTLQYLFAFLDSFDYTSVTRDQLEVSDDRLINASILGKIFEKINGYKDGSIYTPGFITMYMCREAIRPAVVNKFNERYDWGIKSFDGLYNKISTQTEPAELLEYNSVIDELRICDPAVGSGHFLVSALNELIVIKHELGLLSDDDGKGFRNMHIVIEDDELRITDSANQPFHYEIVDGKPLPEVQRFQKSLFHQKERIIENCLFGVDINPNSVAICQLRLWIELLKHAYYIEGTNYLELETLPNIDINIKRGNSLISEHELDDLFTSQSTRQWVEEYRKAVRQYMSVKDRSLKQVILRKINDFREKFASQLPDPTSEIKRQIDKKLAILAENQNPLFYERRTEEKERRVERVKRDIERLTEHVSAIKRQYADAFEWRFEFPEALDENGSFKGFDCIIGNPPYIRGGAIGFFKKHLLDKYEVYAPVADILVYFYELGLRLTKPNAPLSYITSNKFIKSGYGEPLRWFLLKYQMDEMIDFGELPVFENAATFPTIIRLNNKPKETNPRFTQVKDLKFASLADVVSRDSFRLTAEAFQGITWTLARSNIVDLIRKIEMNTVPLSKYVGCEPEFGIKTGRVEAFVIDNEQRQKFIDVNPECAEILVPFADGDDIRKFRVEFEPKFLILTRIGVDINRYPAIFEHLSKYEDKLRKRGDKGDFWWELRSCAYYQDFENPRIIYPDIAMESRMTFSERPLYVSNTAYIIPTDDKAVLGILNSKLMFFYYAQISSVLGDAEERGRLRWLTQYVNELPIRKPDSETEQKLNDLVTSILDKKANRQPTDQDEASIEKIVYDLYQMTVTEREVIDNFVSKDN